MGDGEKSFFYDGEFCGTADTCHHAQIEIAAGASHLITEPHLLRTWNRLKRRYPLLAARIVELDEGATRFVVEEERLRSLIEGEFAFKSLAEEEMPNLLEGYHNGPRKLSRNLMASLEFILHPNTSGKEDGSLRASVLLNICHCMTDGAANYSAMKTLFDFIVSPPDDTKHFADCGSRLAMVPPARMLSYGPGWSLAKQRWKLAMAWACMQYRERTLTGGHTLPKKQQIVSSVPTPACSKQFWTVIEKELGTTILQNCRRNGITFGHALYVLCQLAHSMILHRRRKSISHEEWSDRIRQPMHFGGPVNARPYFDQEWLRRGGATEVFFAITFARVTLPLMPRVLEGDLTYGKMISQNAFLHRCQGVRRQMTSYLNHPLMLQFGILIDQRACVGKRIVLDKWRDRNNQGRVSKQSVMVPKSALLGDSGAVISNGGSSLGALDTLTPLRYPLKNSGGKILLRITNMSAYLRCRIGELYLISTGREGAIALGCWFDNNVYEEELVKEWVTEVSMAAKHYLATPIDERTRVRASL